ncbi:unnamed protein product [Boreogadus saida]
MKGKGSHGFHTFLNPCAMYTDFRGVQVRRAALENTLSLQRQNTELSVSRWTKGELCVRPEDSHLSPTPPPGFVFAQAHI